jgi:hypothetical protein
MALAHFFFGFENDTSFENQTMTGRFENGRAGEACGYRRGGLGRICLAPGSVVSLEMV